MARISGVDLPREKRIEIGLTYVYGIGRVRASKILEEAGVNPDTRVKDLTDEEVAKIEKCSPIPTQLVLSSIPRFERLKCVRHLQSTIFDSNENRQLIRMCHRCSRKTTLSVYHSD